MDRRGYEQLIAVVEPLGYEVVPTPEAGEDVPFFDVLSECSPIAVANVLNVLRQAKRSGELEVSPFVVAVQSNRMTLEDVRG